MTCQLRIFSGFTGSSQDLSPTKTYVRSWASSSSRLQRKNSIFSSFTPMRTTNRASTLMNWLNKSWMPSKWYPSLICLSGSKQLGRSMVKCPSLSNYKCLSLKLTSKLKLIRRPLMLWLRMMDRSINKLQRWRKSAKLLLETNSSRYCVARFRRCLSLLLSWLPGLRLRAASALL